MLMMNTLQKVIMQRTHMIRLAVSKVSCSGSRAEFRPMSSALPNRSLLLDNRSTTQLQGVVKRMSSSIVEDGAGTHKPTPFQKKILVWGKIYQSEQQIPEKVTRNQLKKAMDKFRIRAGTIMAAATFVTAMIVALIGRKQRQEGQTVSKNASARYQS